jgi:hypothetical protein
MGFSTRTTAMSLSFTIAVASSCCCKHSRSSATAWSINCCTCSFCISERASPWRDTGLRHALANPSIGVLSCISMVYIVSNSSGFLFRLLCNSFSNRSCEGVQGWTRDGCKQPAHNAPFPPLIATVRAKIQFERFSQDQYGRISFEQQGFSQTPLTFKVAGV